MSRIRSKDTEPELIVRKISHNLGYRYRLHRKDLPGKPDLVFPKRKKVIFVHGCFWHCHSCKIGRRRPASNQDYWDNKLTGNKRRDRENLKKLTRIGWKYLIIWGCEVKKKNRDKVRAKIDNFLKDS